MSFKRILSLAALCVTSLCADEGLWLFNQFPKEQVAKK
jgi:hypothetical protein